MTGIAFVFVSAGIIGLAGAALGVRDLKRKAQDDALTNMPQIPCRACFADKQDGPQT